MSGETTKSLTLNAPVLVVGKITWGTTGTNHTLTIYQPNEKLNLGEPAGRPPSLVFKLDQAALNTLTFGYSDFGILDEIRFGATDADAGGKTDMNPGESPFVMKHPRSGKWIIFVNGGYAVSDDPLKFPRIEPYPFKAGIFVFSKPHDEGKGTFYHADDDGAGFAHEIIEFNGQRYLTGAVGTDGHTRLKFTPIEWTKDALALAPEIEPLPNGSGK